MFPVRVIAVSVFLGVVSASSEKMSGGSFSLDGNITGGGGSAQGGTFQLLGEIARPISGQATGGSFTLQTVPTWTFTLPVGDFELDIVRSGSSLTLSWPSEASGYILESTAALGSVATWNTVPGATGQNTISVQPQGTAQFFRLRAPR